MTANAEGVPLGVAAGGDFFLEGAPGIEVREWVREMRLRYLLQHEEATEFWLMRHGDCYEQEFPAHLEVFDPPLSRLGRLQAEALAQRLAGSGIVATYASHLQRARQTATIAGASLGLTPGIFEDLQELRARLDGPELMRDVRQGAVNSLLFWRHGKRSPDVVTMQETRSMAARRMGAVIAELATLHPGQRVGIFAHGSVISAYIADVLGVANHSLRMYTEYTSISTVRVRGRSRTVSVINDAAHLAGVPYLPHPDE